MELHQARRMVPGLEGLRGLAVLAVIGYHFFPDIVEGGYLGVVIFFVLSGYLIGNSLLYRPVSVWQFWKQRWLRLYPPLTAMLVGVIPATALFAPALLRGSLADVLSALTYTNNWWQIIRGDSYFVQFANPSLFTHLWSLAIEMQFYLLIAPLLLLLKRLLDREQAIGILLLLPLAASALCMAWLYQRGLDPSRVYFGTDTRFFSLLVGVVGACFYPLSGRGRRSLFRSQGSVVSRLAWPAVLAMIGFCWLAGFRQSFVYYGGMLLFSLLCLVVIIGLREEESRLSAVLSMPPLRVLGRRSYGLYLWQYPLMLLFQRFSPTALLPYRLSVVLQTIILMILGELTYQLVESSGVGPFHPVESWYRFKSGRFSMRGSLASGSSRGWKELVPYWLTACAFGLTAVLLVLAPRGESEETVRLKAAISSGEAIVREDAKASGAETRASGAETKAQTEQIQSVDQTKQPEETKSAEQEKKAGQPQIPEVSLTAADLEKAKTQKYLILGDSILLSNAAALKQTFPQSQLVAEVGLQLYQAEDELDKIGDDKLPKNIVIGLGTNSPVSAAVMTGLVNRLKNHHVYFVTIEGNVSHKERINDQLAEAAKDNANVTLIDWSAYAREHKDWFYGDSVHPNEVGITKYHAFLAKNMIDNYR